MLPRIERMWEVSARGIRSLEQTCGAGDSAPVFTVNGRYTSRGWTEWTQGFQFGSALLQFDATGEREFLDIGRARTVEAMAPHVTHFGVHDHGFNNVSTYGNLLRLMNEGRIEENPWERCLYEMALRCSGAVQARRWTAIADGGFIHSFNGPHSLFADTLRSLRSLALAHRLGHIAYGENDERIPLLGRLVEHARATAMYTVYYGKGRDIYDVRGRVAHESVFNVADGRYRCPSTQQGYSPFTTWTRALAWVICGFAEQLEFLETLDESALGAWGSKEHVRRFMLEAARATADYYLDVTPVDGVPYWDTGAPGLVHLGDYLNRPSDPFNEYEPVDSSASAVAAQGLVRLGCLLGESGARYLQAGLAVLRTLLDEPYLNTDPEHQGVLLHSVYHRPNGWDHIPRGRATPCGESSMWGDYHLRELALVVQRLARNEKPLRFWGS